MINLHCENMDANARGLKSRNLLFIYRNIDIKRCFYHIFFAYNFSTYVVFFPVIYIVCTYFRAEAVYQSMKSSFGHQSCHLLQINSRSLTTVETMKMDTSLPDPWGQFLNKPIDVGVGFFFYFFFWQTILLFWNRKHKNICLI